MINEKVLLKLLNNHKEGHKNWDSWVKNKWKLCKGVKGVTWFYVEIYQDGKNLYFNENKGRYIGMGYYDKDTEEIFTSVAEHISA